MPYSEKIFICLPRLPFCIPGEHSQIKERIHRADCRYREIGTCGRTEFAAFLPQQNYSEKSNTEKKTTSLKMSLSMFDHGLPINTKASGFLHKKNQKPFLTRTGTIFQNRSVWTVCRKHKEARFISMLRRST